MDQASKWYKKSRPIASAFILGGVPGKLSPKKQEISWSLSLFYKSV